LGDDGDGVQQQPVEDEYDAFFGSGSELMDVDLPEDSAVNSREAAAIRALNEKLAELTIGHCSGCREEGFDVKMKTPTLCTRCSADTTNDVRKWSDENNTNPSRVPPELQNLTDMEEMLIARCKTVMQVRYTKG
ncbi:hypothetical protein FB45DRAFT_717826, partial [Roridomyces roridus]